MKKLRTVLYVVALTSLVKALPYVFDTGSLAAAREILARRARRACV